MGDVAVGQDTGVGRVVDNPMQPGWGPGRVVAIKGNNLWVVFRDHPGHEAKLMTPTALRLAASQSDPILDNLPEPELVNGRPVLPGQRSLFSEMVKSFLARYPKGFGDPAYVGRGRDGERASTWAAHERFQTTLGEGELRRMTAEDEVKSAVNRIVDLVGSVNVLGRTDRLRFADALKNKDAARAYLAALVEVVEASDPSGDTFTPLVEAVAGLKESSSWPVATLIPFLARPEAHLLLRPNVVQKAAQGLSFDLKYRPAPNWATYERCLLLASIYRQKLAETERPELAPQDLIDVQAFIWSAGADSAKAGRGARGRKPGAAKKR